MTNRQSSPKAATGIKWGAKEKTAWFANQTVQRSYQNDVAARLQSLSEHFLVEQYAALSYGSTQYPLFVVRSPGWDSKKPTALITGGVHGYETSGVHGALHFLEKEAFNYSTHFNIIVVPCVSPWGYETINRWNPDTVDPNRSFYENSPAKESNALMELISSLNCDITVHIDLHETTDSDNRTFRPALAARDGVEQPCWTIPDGFYLVGDIEHPATDFQKAIIDEVQKVTHIAPADVEGNIIGLPISQDGVINYAAKELGLCMGITSSQYTTTTEVYPDSPRVTKLDCIIAQVAAIKSALDYVMWDQ